MKKIFVILLLTLILTGCGSNNQGTTGEETKSKEVKITVNSATTADKECNLELSGECVSWIEPEKDFYLLLDVTIENISKETISVGFGLADANFALKDANGTSFVEEIMLDIVENKLSGTMLSGDKITGQIVYDVTEQEEYYLYYTNAVTKDTIKITIKDSDIQK